MPSVNKTANLKLNQWQGNEYPKRADFVEDNKLIDEAFGKITEEVKNIDLSSTKVIRPNDDTVEKSLTANETSIKNIEKELEKTNTDLGNISSNSNNWQKYKVTDDIGRCKILNNQDANNIILAGFYNGNEMSNMPNNSAEWWYLEVIPHSSHGYCYQIATQLGSEAPKKYHRSQTNGTWNTWRRL